MNELNVLQYSEDSNHIESVANYAHNDQIWAVESCPTDTSLVITSRQGKSNSKCLTMWSMPNQTQKDIDDDLNISYSQEAVELVEISTFNHNEKTNIVTAVDWHSTERTLLTVDGKLLSSWNIGESKISVSFSD